MPSSETEVFSILCDLLTPFNKDNLPLSFSTQITTELEMDSVAVMDFIMEVEDHFNIDIPLNVLSDIKTIGDLTAFLQTKGT